MRRKKHKKKVNHIVIFTTDAVDAKVRQCKIRPLVGTLLVIIACVVIGTIIGVFMYEEKIFAGVQETVSQKEDVIRQYQDELKLKEEDIQLLQDEKVALQEEIAQMTEKITVLSETVNLKAESLEIVQAELDAQSIPVGFPMTGSATIQEIVDGDPLCIFSGTENTLVVAAANGTVLSIEEDLEYGHKITVDHGNGYTTIYRNKGNVLVKQGDVIFRGFALFIIEKDNLDLGYQITKDGVYVNPMDIISISG